MPLFCLSTCIVMFCLELLGGWAVVMCVGGGGAIAVCGERESVYVCCAITR